MRRSLGAGGPAIRAWASYSVSTPPWLTRTHRAGQRGRVAWLAKQSADWGLPLVSVSPLEHGPSTTLGAGQADQSDVK